jgi:hypothetical protein
MTASFNNTLLQVSSGFPQFFKTNAEIISQVNLQLLPAISFPNTMIVEIIIMQVS